MANSQPFRSVELYDEVSLFPDGMNSGLNPLLIPKTQLAFATNTTVRTGFATHRPPYTKNLNISYPSEAIQEVIEQGLFQGAAYYQPDSGNQSLFASISGRLFQFQVQENDVTVFERTVPGSPNPETSTQSWMWQAENYLIVNDGESLPVFFDGQNSRRSYGPSVLLATATAGPATAPIPGETITVTLSVPYTGQYDIPVLFEGEYWQPVASASGYEVSALCLFDQTTQAIPEGTPVYIKPSILGALASQVNPSGSFSTFASFINLTLTEPYAGVIGSGILLFGKLWQVWSFTGNTITARALSVGTYYSLPAGTQIQYSSSSAPATLVGTVTVAAISPGLGNTIPLFISNLFSGTPGQTVYIGDQGQYKITAVAPPPPGASLTMINLTAGAGSALTYPSEIVSVPELPAGRMGAYGLGQNWVALVDGLSYIASDFSRGPSGTQANSFRDAVLKTTNLTFLGGNFSIPGSGNVITSITFTANLDLSLGQGSLQIGTTNFMASNLAPFDYANPPATGPILTFSLIGSGPVGQNSTIAVNSDIRFRSISGLGSLIQARRDFDVPGNTPIGREMVRVLALDNQKLLTYASKAYFDNRELQTCSPQASSQGVIHPGLVVTNFDPVSGAREKQPPVYDGLWTGINVLQLVGGIFGGRERLFAFTFNVSLSKIELYELLPTGDQHFDNGTIPIVWGFETGALFNADIKDRGTLCSLLNGEMAIDDVIGRVDIQVFYKSDQYGGTGAESCWTPWHSFSVCAEEGSKPLYFPRLGLGEPSATQCDSTVNKPLREGYTFQFKFVFRGHCRFLRARFSAATMPIPKFEPPICNLTQ